MNIFNNSYVKILLLIVAAFVISAFAIDNIFLAGTPKVNPFFAQNMRYKLAGMWTSTTNFVALRNWFPNRGSANDTELPEATGGQNNVAFTETINEAFNTPVSQLSKGVYAGEREGTRVYEVKTEELDYTEYTFNVNGKSIKIRVPKTETPPSQEVMEEIYK